MRRTRQIIITLLLIVALLLALKKIIVNPLKNLFKAEKVTIDKTPILIKDIKSIGQLITYRSLDEVVVDSTIITPSAAFVNSFNKLSPFPVLPAANKELVLIGRGKVLAGVNLSLVNDTGVSIKNDTVHIALPKAQILDVILNPSDFETFVEKGSWNEGEVLLVKAKAQRKITEDALRQNILVKANNKAKTIMEAFLQNLGYKYVVVQ